jgi:UDP-glucuronate 4-epimerase
VAITGLRFFTVYGAFGRPDMAYFSFANNIVQGKPIKIFQGEGGTELARDFTFIGGAGAGRRGRAARNIPTQGVRAAGVVEGSTAYAHFVILAL